MADNDLEYIVRGLLTDAASYIDEEVGPQRAKAMRFYRGDKFGDEQEGRSQVVSRDVHDVIMSVLPSINRTFFGGEKMVEYAPRRPDAVASAEQASEYVNYLLEENDFTSSSTALQSTLCCTVTASAKSSMSRKKK